MAMQSGWKCVQLAVLLIAVAVIAAVVVSRRYSFSAASGTTQQQQAAATVQAGRKSLISRRCQPADMLCGVDHSDTGAERLLNLFDIDALKTQYHSLMTRGDFSLCKNFSRFGHDGDGGYDICVTPPFRPEPKQCLVYSFGISGDWTFDEGMAKYGCEIHSFDPSIGQKDHTHEPGGIHFHNLGLWGSDIVNTHRWTLEKLSTIRKRLGHEKRVIDVIKVDVEGAEWPFLRNLVDEEPEQFNSIRQLLLETHTPRYNPHKVSRDDMLEIVYYTSRLVELGLNVVRNRQVNWCCGTFAPLMPPGVAEKCCHETFYVNKQFLGLRPQS